VASDGERRGFGEEDFVIEEVGTLVAEVVAATDRLIYI
jgi:hypothetical protein